MTSTKEIIANLKVLIAELTIMENMRVSEIPLWLENLSLTDLRRRVLAAYEYDRQHYGSETSSMLILRNGQV